MKKEIKKVFHYAVKICKEDSICDKTGFEKSELNVAVQNDRFLILDNSYFTKLEKTGNSMGYNRINKPYLSIRHKSDSCFSAGVFYSIYSTSRKRPSTIRNTIAQYIEKESFWMSGIDLSFIK